MSTEDHFQDATCTSLQIPKSTDAQAFTVGLPYPRMQKYFSTSHGATSFLATGNGFVVAVCFLLNNSTFGKFHEVVPLTQPNITYHLIERALIPVLLNLFLDKHDQ